jgi:hypothetical protein
MYLKLPATPNVPAIDFRKFLSRWGTQIVRARREIKKEKIAQKKARFMRPFHPQCGVKVDRADTNDYNRSLGRIYLTLSNGQVIRPDKFLKRNNANPVLREKVIAYLDEQS